MKNLNRSRTVAARLFASAMLVVIANNTLAAVHYVDVNSASPTPPYDSWAAAATNIQDAVDAAVAGDEIVVTNGIYATGGRSFNGTTINIDRVAVDKPLRLQSVNGPQSTTIDGGGSVRCAELTTGASLSGFTLTNGWILSSPSGFPQYFYGAGVDGGTLTNCILSGNRADGRLDNGYVVGGGAFNATLYNCTLTGNSALDGGAGAANCTLYNCMLAGNSVPGTLSKLSNDGTGGGASDCTLYNCTLINNSAQGGVNVSDWGSGGVASGSTLNNCALSGNSADIGGGAIGGALNNCISYFNIANEGANYAYATLNYSCTTPLPTNGVGNITKAPLFLDLTSGNLQLQPNSPCINAGLSALAPAGLDLNGNPRIMGGTVDIGAYEFQSPTSIISYAWLQQYRLPTDGSADTADPDGDGLNNWQEWRCGTDPTKALSGLRLLAPMTVGTNVTLSWQSVAGVNYFLERATDLGRSATFVALATGIPGQPGTTTFTDTNAVGAGSWFYRVGVSTP